MNAGVTIIICTPAIFASETETLLTIFITKMKKVLFILAAAAAMFAVSCSQKAGGDTTPAAPTNIDAAFTNLVKGDIVKGEVNKFPVSASASDAQLDLTFYSDNVYIPAGSYTVGTAKGNYEGKFKNKDVDAAIKSGAISVAIEGEGNYTLTGTLRLDNEAGTVLKLNATGSLPYETPTEFYYTVEEQTIGGTKANVYKIYDLESNPVAEAACTGAEDGTYEVSAQTLLPVQGSAGTWVNVEGYGIEAYIHGKVTVTTTFGKKTFLFEDNHTVSLANCQLKQDITPNIVDNGPFTWGFYTITEVESPVVRGKYEITMKLFYRLEGDVLGPEFMSITILTNEMGWMKDHQGSGFAAPTVPYSEYANYNAEDALKYNEELEGRIAPEGASYLFVHGVRTSMGLTVDTEKFVMGNMQPLGSDIVLLMCPTDMAYQTIPAVNEMCSNGIWDCMGTPAPEN